MSSLGDMFKSCVEWLSVFAILILVMAFYLIAWAVPVLIFSNVILGLYLGLKFLVNHV